MDELASRTCCHYRNSRGGNRKKSDTLIQTTERWQGKRKGRRRFIEFHVMTAVVEKAI
jgi:hypothetical protein